MHLMVRKGTNSCALRTPMGVLKIKLMRVSVQCGPSGRLSRVSQEAVWRLCCIPFVPCVHCVLWVL